MRRVLLALVVLGLPMTAMAKIETDGALADGTQRLDRWVFGATGSRAEDVAARRCGRYSTVAVTRHHTAGDVAAAALTLGWYTPEHATFACAPSTNR